MVALNFASPIIPEEPLDSQQNTKITHGSEDLHKATTEGSTVGPFDPITVGSRNLWQPNETWSAQLRELLSNSSQLNAWSAQAFASFKSKFNPQKLLQDAQVR